MRMKNRSLDLMSEGNHSVLQMALHTIWEVQVVATHSRVVGLKTATRYHADNNGHVTHHHEEVIEDPDGTPTLILYYDKAPCALELIYDHDIDRAALLIEGWLEHPHTNYGTPPFHGGRNEKGWRMFTDITGEKGPWPNVIVAIQPTWAMYDK